MAVKQPDDLLTGAGIRRGLGDLAAGLDPSAALMALLGWVASLPLLAKVAASLALLWLAVLTGMIVFRFTMMLLGHAIVGGLLFVDYASMQAMRVLMRGWGIVQGVTLLAVGAALWPFRFAMAGIAGTAQRVTGSVKDRPRRRKAASGAGTSGSGAAGPKAGGELAWALGVLGLPPDCTRQALRDRLRELRQHLNSDQNKFLTDAFIQQVNQAGDIVKSKMGVR